MPLTIFPLLWPGGWRRLHNEELCNLHITSNIITVVRSRRMRCMGHIAYMGEMRNVSENLKGRDCLEDLCIDVEII
jgi:hypothetical protein